MANPGDGDLAGSEFGKDWFAMLAGAPGEESFPNHLVKERPRVEVLRGSQVFKRFWQCTSWCLRRLWHIPFEEITGTIDKNQTENPCASRGKLLNVILVELTLPRDSQCQQC